MSTTVPLPNPIHRRVEKLAPPVREPLRFDPLMALAALGLIACSLIVISDATSGDIPGSPHHYLVRQSVYAVIGLGLMVALSRIDYSRLRELRHGLYGAMLGLILVVLALGTAARGSRRTLSLPFFSFQPAELGKLLLILALAGFVVGRVRRLRDRDTTARAALLALVPALLVMLEPDLGSGMVYAAIAVTMLFVAGTSWRHFAALAALAAVAVTVTLVAAPAAGIQVLKPYQRERLTGFLNPSSDPRNQTYQINQSRIAIGAGGKTGRGAAHATQTRLNFLPAHHTDFIFAVVGEEFGFLGAAVALSLYALLIWRALRVLTFAKNLYGALVAGGIVAMLMFQVFVNAGMTVGIMPITGVPLPLVSYGGSSVLVTLMALGILQSIHAQARLAAAHKGRALTI
jgi:rod shape determining protein RodA